MHRSIGTTLACIVVAALATPSPSTAARPRPTRPEPKPASGVKIMASEADPNALATLAAASLQKAAGDFAAQKKALPVAESGTGTSTYGADDLNRLIGTADTAVSEALKEPELAALKDAAARAIRRAQAALGPLGKDPQIAKDAADKALQPLGAFLDKLAALAAKGPVTVDLCVMSKPEPGAKFSYRPAGDPAAVKTLAATDGKVTAVRGLYVYKLDRPDGKGKPIQCGWDPAGAAPAGLSEPCLDLFEDGKQALVCDLAAGTCTRAAGSCP